MQLCDSHVHLGQFYDLYTSPPDLLEFMDQMGIDRVAVSSISACEGDFEKVYDEIAALVSLGGDRIVPTLWTTPEGIERGAVVALAERIVWGCLKIHPQFNDAGWHLEGNPYMEVVLQLSQRLNLPILIHTGYDGNYAAGIFECLIRTNPEQIFILAHGRPLDQAYHIHTHYRNAWIDTAFMLMDDQIWLATQTAGERILWGSDFPVMKYYNRKIPANSYYQQRIDELRQSVSRNVFNKIFNTNFQILF